MNWLLRKLRGAVRRLSGARREAGSGPSSSGYVVIDREAALATRLDGWFDRSVAERQDAAFARLIDAMRAGRPRVDLVVLAEAIAATGLAAPELLEIGCGSGYCSEAIAHLGTPGVRYTGLDYSEEMIDVARERYPGLRFVVGDAAALPFENGAFDIAVDGVALMHIVDYERAVAECVRVAREWAIFHTVPVLGRRPTTFLRKEAYGSPTVEVIINEAELLSLFERSGLRVVRAWESLPYDLRAVLGEPTTTRTYLCRVT